MDERERDKGELESFKKKFRSGLIELLDNAEVLLDIPRPPDPASMGFDERTLEELTDRERKKIQEIIFQELGIDPQEAEEVKLRDYQSRTTSEIKRQSGLVIPIGTVINVSVYRTNRTDSDIYLQELTFPDQEKRWLVGPDQNI